MKTWIVPTTNVLDTVELIHNIIEEEKTKPAIRGLALKLIRNLPENNQLAEIRKLFYFVRDNIRFVKDVEGIETLQYPENTIKWKGGDCDCKMILLGSLLASIGHKVRFAIYKINNPHKYDHINIQVYLKRKGKWLTLDPTRKSRPLGWSPKKFFDRRVIDFKKGGIIT